MLAHGKNIEGLCCCQGPVAYAHRQRSVALRAEIGGSQAVWGGCIRIDFRRVSEAGFTAQTPTEQGESPDTLSILARDPLPLRLCTFAPLRSFPPTAGISARDPLPLRLCTFRAFAFFSSNSLTRGLPPHPPRPLLPQPKPWGRGGAKRFRGRQLSPAKAHAAHKESGVYHS